MTERGFYINEGWYSYDEAHNLFGITRLRPSVEVFYKKDMEVVSVRKDVEDSTLYDVEDKLWKTDILAFSITLYRNLGSLTVYKGSQSIIYNLSFSKSLYSETPTHVEHEGTITDLTSLYSDNGITTYPCEAYHIKDGEVLAWYDDRTRLYWDVNQNKWVTSYSSSSTAKYETMLYVREDNIYGSVYVFETDGIPTTRQAVGGTIRRSGNNNNSYTFLDGSISRPWYRS